jgi:very-short-patch-repair endonuclease
VLIEGELVDFVWPQQRLIVEIDGFTFHRTHAAFENDRRRDRELHKRGWRVIRVTYRQLQEEPHTVIKDITQMLSQ